MITDLTEGSPSKKLFWFSLPLLASVAFQQLYQMADSIIAGRFAGELALAAVGASFPITQLFVAVATGVNIGASVLVSQLFGAKKYLRMKSAVSTALLTTVAIALILTVIGVFATGGIGGVHRGAETTMDISADLEELASTPVMVVCAGAKSILDLGLTLEYLETHGVPVLGYGTKELPAFYTRKSGFEVDYRVDTPAELAAAFRASLDLGLRGGMLVTNPIPEEFAMDHEVINRAIDEAVAQANAQGIHGKATTPFLLAKVKELTGGDSLDSNIQLVFNNARLAAQTAAELCRLG